MNSEGNKAAAEMYATRAADSAAGVAPDPLVLATLAQAHATLALVDVLTDTSHGLGLADLIAGRAL